MIKKILLLAFVVSLCSCSHSFTGTWKETWGVGQETDVTYNDLYVITQSGSSITIQCNSDDDQTFENIIIKGKSISFDLHNGDFTVPYKLALKGKQKLAGKAVSIHGKEVIIHWDKQ